MANHRLIVAFTRLSDADFQVRVGAILAALTNHPRMPEPWPEPVPALAQLRQEDAAYRELQQAVQRRDFGQLRKRDEARDKLSRSLQRVASYAELLANGDVDLLQSTGFEVRREGGRPMTFAGSTATRIGPPEDFRVGLGPRAGSLQVDATRQRGAIAYEVQTTRGDPAQDEGWRQALIVPTVRRVVVDNLTPGVTWARLRAVRSGGLSGPWTSPISVIVN
ncbi:MAG: hypothetical protein RL722_1241 [Pseudomonadota bacterium]|jgi:hypothetical protein